MELNEKYIFNRLPSYISINENLNNLQKHSISYSISSETLQSFNFDPNHSWII